MKLFLLVIVGSLLCSNAFADRISDIVEAKCLKCHDGNNPDDRFPALGGQTPEFLYKSMKDYVTGDRNNRIGVRMMKNRVIKFDDATLKGIADYYAATTPPAPIAGNPELMAKGKEIYTKGIKEKGVKACSKCHGKQGEGDEVISRVAGQWNWYLADQMYWYKTGEIKDQDMIDIARKMTDDEVKAVSEYMQSL